MYLSLEWQKCYLIRSDWCGNASAEVQLSYRANVSLVFGIMRESDYTMAFPQIYHHPPPTPTPPTAQKSSL